MYIFGYGWQYTKAVALLHLTGWWLTILGPTPSAALELHLSTHLLHHRYNHKSTLFKLALHKHNVLFQIVIK